MATQTINGNLTTHGTVSGNLNTHGRLSGGLSVGGGTTDYNELENKPTYNGHIIEGELTSESLGIWQPKNFSTEEQNTGIKWIDGKDLYQKTYVFTTASGYQLIPLNIDNIETFFIKNAFIRTNVEVAVLSSYRGASANSEEFIGLLNVQNKSFDYRCGVDLIGGTGVITILYTKSL